MKLHLIRPNAYHLRGGSNAGLLVHGKEALVIDAGLDDDAGRRILRLAEGLGVSITAILITHAHADHFGGGAFLRRRTGAPVYAPAVEAGIVAHPLLEPLFLFGGAMPIAELRGRFTLARRACPVDHPLEPGTLSIGPFTVEVVPLPGHAPNQVGIAWEDVLFCADAFFPTEVLQKHPIPFCADVGPALETLARLPAMPYAFFAPGHGDVLTPETLPAVIEANRQRLQAILRVVQETLDEPRETAVLLKAVADHLGAEHRAPWQHYLAQTTVLAALAYLREQGLVDVEMRENRLLWTRKPEPFENR